MNSKEKNRLLISHLKVHIPNLEGSKMFMRIIFNDGRFSLKTKKFEAKQNVNKIDINQHFEIEEKDFISSIRFEVYEKRGFSYKLLYRSFVDIENKKNMLKDEFSNFQMCYLMNSNGENCLSLYYNIEINQNILDFFETKLKNLQDDKKVNNNNQRSTFDYFKEIANTESAENFTDFIKNIGYLKVILNEIISFFTWEHPWKTLGLALILSVALIYYKLFFIIFPIFLICIHVIKRKNFNDYILNSTNNCNLQNLAFIKMNVSEYNKLINSYENFLHKLQSLDTKMMERIYLNLLKVVVFNALFLLCPVGLNIFLLIGMWMILLINHNTFLAFIYFFLLFIKTNLLGKILRIPKIQRISENSSKLVSYLKDLIPFCDLYEEYIFKNSNPEYKLVEISNMENMANELDYKKINILSMNDNLQKKCISPNNHLKNDTILKFEVLENERWWLLAGWTKSLILNERFPYTDITGTKPLNMESVFLPSDDSYSWADVWKVIVSNTTDEQGWIYANDFKSEFSEKNSATSYVRTRKWIRFACKKNT